MKQISTGANRAGMSWTFANMLAEEAAKYKEPPSSLAGCIKQLEESLAESHRISLMLKLNPKPWLEAEFMEKVKELENETNIKRTKTTL